ncbi:12938_t:CDS:2 [Gigaspora margarita]|uniref:12938_t:CDS:1 n=1 Tax=Gigaspora margarita TaxID=4874 RepID=A0ABN7UES8_GIGMA|nr:12938_t:CDS:2 [Gigaspora margarita]
MPKRRNNMPKRNKSKAKNHRLSKSFYKLQCTKEEKELRKKNLLASDLLRKELLELARKRREEGTDSDDNKQEERTDSDDNKQGSPQERFQENGASKPEKISFHNANCLGRQNHNDEYGKFTSPNSSKCNNFSRKGEDCKIYVRGISSQVTKDQQFSNTIEGEIYTNPIIVSFECCPNNAWRLLKRGN